MNTQEIAEKAGEVLRYAVRLKEIEAEAKEIKAAIAEAEAFLCETFRDNMIGEITVDGMHIKAGYETKYGVKGGDVENPEKKTPLVDMLVELGYLEPEKVKKITDGRAVNASTLAAAIRKAAAGTPAVIETLQGQDLLSVYDAPVVKIK